LMIGHRPTVTTKNSRRRRHLNIQTVASD
jgi:hypothetical protein